MDKKAAIKVITCVAAAGALFLINPFGLTANNNLVFSGLLLAILLWSVDVFAKKYVAVGLLVVFLTWGESPAAEVFRFPLSPDFVLIAFSFLFSQGIVNANIADLFSGLVMKRYGNSPLKLVFVGIICSIALIFIVPQPFARVIMLAAVYREFFKKHHVDERIAEAVLYSLFVFATVSYMLFRNGDIILNSAAISFAELEISFGGWMGMMFLPSVITGLLILGGYLYAFRKELFEIPYEVKVEEERSAVTKRERQALWIIGIVVLLWITEGYHGVGADIVIVAGTLAMYLIGVVNRADLKQIHIDLLFFLTAAFAIGPVMKHTGIADQVFSHFTGAFPDVFSMKYLLMIVVCTMMLHMVLGSTITTLSVVLPGLLTLSAGTVPPVIVMLSAYIAVNLHYILPFHHVTIMIGAGKQYYTNKTVLKFGIYLTVITLISILGIFYPYWKMTGTI